MVAVEMCSSILARHLASSMEEKTSAPSLKIKVNSGDADKDSYQRVRRHLSASCATADDSRRRLRLWAATISTPTRRRRTRSMRQGLGKPTDDGGADPA